MTRLSWSGQDRVLRWYTAAGVWQVIGWGGWPWRWRVRWGRVWPAGREYVIYRYWLVGPVEVRFLPGVRP